jgi:hypothetical protein
MASPLDISDAKLHNGEDSLWQVIGDSTGQGQMVGTLQDTGKGWVGRLAVKRGIKYDCNVTYSGATYTGPAIWGGYVDHVTLRTSTNPSAPTLHVNNGSAGATRSDQAVTWIASNGMIPDTTADVCFTAHGFNDMTAAGTAAFLGRMQNLITAIRTRLSTCPIVITTQNQSMGTYPSTTFIPGWNDVCNYYVGQPLSLTPALIKSTSPGGNIWVMDTRQAWPTVNATLASTGDGVGGLHPTALGYEEQAVFMDAIFPAPSPEIFTTELPDVIRTEFFHQNILAYGEDLEWTLIGDLPNGLTFNDSPPTISGYPTAYGGTYDFTLRAENDYGFDEQQFTGEIISYVYPFIPDREVVWKMKWHGNWYPVQMKVKTGGAFKPIVFKA